MLKETTRNKVEIKNQVLEAMNFRHATKKYDASRKILDEDFEYILEAGRLSPSSLGSDLGSLLSCKILNYVKSY